jgi:hypothetical protein
LDFDAKTADREAFMSNKSQIDPTLLLRPFSGLINGVSKSQPLELWLNPEGTVLAFLRHLGCTFCRQTIVELKEASNSEGFPNVVFVHQGSTEAGRELFERFWPEATAISDEALDLYKAFGIQRGSIKQLIGPEALLCGIKGLSKGYGIGVPSGDPTLMPGLFLIQEGQILWNHKYRHAGDLPDLKSLPALLQV